MSTELSIESSTLNFGDKVTWKGGSNIYGCKGIKVPQGNYIGKISWIGNINGTGCEVIAGIEFDSPITGGNDGAWATRHIFSCKPGHGLFLPLQELSKLKKSKSKITLSPKLFRKEKSSCIVDQVSMASSKTNQEKSMNTSSASNSRLNSDSITNSKMDNLWGLGASSSSCSPSLKSNESEWSKYKNSAQFAKPKSSKGGFLNIFKWFSRRETKVKEADVDTIKCHGSSLSLSNDAKDSRFIPIKHSASADTPVGMAKNFSHCRTNKEVSPEMSVARRRKSTSSTTSSVSNVSEFVKGRKRIAPVPPKVTLSTNFKDGNETSSTYGKVKRKAPPPPITSSNSLTDAKKPLRPASTFSDFSSLSQSTTSTLKSSSCSDDGASHKSANPMFPVTNNKGPISPKPWYKRKKGKSTKEKKEAISRKHKNEHDELMMPDIQFARPKLDYQYSVTPDSGTLELQSNDSGIFDSNRLSYLSSISDLDKAAVEIIQREKAQREAERCELNDKFYKTSSTCILNQEDIVQKSLRYRDNKSYNITTKTEEHNFTYDNLEINFHNNSTAPMYANQETVKLLKETIITNKILEPENESNKDYAAGINLNYDEYLEQIRREMEEEDPSKSEPSQAKATPLQRASLDPELFYQLAKDANFTCAAKISKSTPSKDQSGSNSSQSNKSPQSIRSPKNFGLRMNNYFKPDVSIILEGSESVSSSNNTNTPALEYFPWGSSVAAEPTNDGMSLTSDMNSEFKFNTRDLQDIMEGFAADLSICDSDTNNHVENKNLKSKAEKIRDEVLFLREKDNFMAWQKAMQEKENKNSKIESPNSLERKKKWICELCTLVNQPWRLHCEACGNLRPDNPKRVCGTLEVSASYITLGIIDNSQVDSNFIDANNIANRSHNGIENDLQSYFNRFEDQANSMKQITGVNTQHSVTDPVLRNNNESFPIEFHNSFTSDSKENGIRQHEIELEHIRNARLQKFQQNRDNLERTTSEKWDDEKPPKKYDEASNIFVSNDEKIFSKNVFKKSSVVKPSGAVKSAVSIFNQLDQLNQTPPVEKNSTNLKAPKRVAQNFKDFDKIFMNNSEQNQIKEVPKPNRNHNAMKAEIDITSAINKFDDMAAVAEIAKISKVSSRPIKLKPRKIIIDTQIFEQNNTGTGALNSKPLERKVNLRSNSENKGHITDSVIRDGILYTGGESRKRSMSIGSGTFELIQAKDFATIEAHHSRKPSPVPLDLHNDVLQQECSVVPNALEKLTFENYASVSKDSTTTTNDVTADIDNLLNLLEDAISNEKHGEASNLAKKLAQVQLDNNQLNEEDAYSHNRNLPSSLKLPVAGKHEEPCEGASSKPDLPANNISEVEEINQDSSLGSLEQSQISSFSEPSAVHQIDFPSNATDDVFVSLNSSENSFGSESWEEARDIIKRTNKIDPSRREVKSDIMSHTPQLQNTLVEELPLNVEMYVEDKSSHQGPIIIQVTPSLTVGELKIKVSDELGFPVEVQRWILGKRLADDDMKTLSHHNVTAEGCSIFLYLVAPEIKRKLKPNSSEFRQSEEEASVRTRDNFLKNNKSKTKSKNNTKISSGNRKSKKRSTGHHNIKENGANKATEDFETPLTSSIKTTFDGWICPVCTLINSWERPGCEACTAERPLRNDDLQKKSKSINLGQAMRALENQGCVENQDPFECLVCFTEFDKGEGVILRDCLHVFCRDCLVNAVKYSDSAEVKCPFGDKNYSCEFSLQDREIKDLLTESEYKRHLDKSVKQAAGAMQNVFYCKTPDCKGFCQYEDNVNIFYCNVCLKLNCLTCQAQHEGATCKQYQEDLVNKQDEDTLKTKKFFDDIIRRGDGMYCPQCSVMLVRKWGCDWMKCPMCRTEICWVTRGLRWGPKGQGDTSGGCKCGINGRKCHPKCTYCH